MGLSVGETIQGIEHYEGGWNEARLTLLWLGESAAVFRYTRRTRSNETWSVPKESANWDLEHREWEKVPVELTGKLTFAEYLREAALFDFQNATGCNVPEELEDWQKSEFKPVLVGWVNPKDLEKIQDAGSALIWKNQLEPTMIPLYTHPSKK